MKLAFIPFYTMTRLKGHVAGHAPLSRFLPLRTCSYTWIFVSLRYKSMSLKTKIRLKQHAAVLMTRFTAAFEVSTVIIFVIGFDRIRWEKSQETLWFSVIIRFLIEIFLYFVQTNWFKFRVEIFKKKLMFLSDLNKWPKN